MPSALFFYFLPHTLYLFKNMCYNVSKTINERSNRVSNLQDIVAPLLVWYRENARSLPWRERRAPYHVWISEIMLQQTRIEAVIPYYHRFLTAFPTVAALAEAEDDLLMKHWEGLGYYSRARNLKRAAVRIMTEHGGELPRDLALLRALPGVGDYTAGAIASIAFGLPAPAVDGNVLRVLARLTADGRNILAEQVKREAREALAAIYPSAPEDCADLTAAIMELGEVVCIPNGAPRCDACPLAALCRARAEGLTDTLPYREKRPPRTVERRTVLLLTYEGRVGLALRPPEGLLGGLWEFPSADGHLTAEEVRELLALWGLTPTDVTEGPTAKHIFTHREWHMTSFTVSLAGEGGGLTFATPEELRTVYALPTAFRRFAAQYLAE